MFVNQKHLKTHKNLRVYVPSLPKMYQTKPYLTFLWSELDIFEEHHLIRGGDNGLAVWFLGLWIAGDSCSEGDSGLTGSIDRIGGGDNSLAVWFLRLCIIGISCRERNSGFADSSDRLGGGDSILSVWFLRGKIAENRGLAVGIHGLRDVCV